MEVWRLQVNTGEDSIAEYCIENNVAAMGWSLKAVSYTHLTLPTNSRV